MANLTMTNWRIVDKLPYINLGSAGENNASMITITVDALIDHANYYLDIGDENGIGLPNTQELKPNTNVGTNDEPIYTLSMQPMVSWLGKEGTKLLQVRCVYTEDDKQVVKESNVFHAKVDRNSGFVYKYDIAVFEEYLDKIKESGGGSGDYVTEDELIEALRPYATITEMNTAIDGAVDDKQDILQYTILPTASEEELGHIYQYIGETIHSGHTDLVHGYFYECKNLGTESSPYYTWVNLDVIEFPIAIYEGVSSGSVKINNSNNVALGIDSTAEGNTTTASGNQSHAEGKQTTASNEQSHAEGYKTTASGSYSHSEGNNTQATNTSSHAQNMGTIAQGMAQTAIGKYNVSDYNTYAFIIGNGESNNSRSNALAIQWDGTLVFANGETLSPSDITALKALI